MEVNYQVFLGWQCACSRDASTQEYDSAIYSMRDLLREHSLIGYHCTKLTRREIKSIRSHGMLLQNLASLNDRISQLEKDGLLSPDVAVSLKNKNQADDENRAKKLWFCFYEPYLAGRYGIEIFFRSWGGEALYNSHEDHPITGKALLEIGVPCVIKAHVPIKKLKDSYYPDTAMIRAFLSQRGHRIENRIEHEGYSVCQIGSQNIVDIFEYPSGTFNKLTKCKEWISS